ncbi:MAG: ATP-binding protein [Kiritimatiellia bacterium]
MKRKIIRIDESKCNGCGACANACHEGAIGMVNGKAKLLRDDYCDGMGDCLPSCPTGAITFEEREAAPYDERAVETARKARQDHAPTPGGCPGKLMRSFDRAIAVSADATSSPRQGEWSTSQLGQWPCQIKLVPVNAPYFNGAKLLIAADCAAYAYAGMHQEFMRGRITLIGCPKLDQVDYAEKLGEIIRRNDIRSVTVVRMEVPCCGGLELAAKQALQGSGKFIPWRVVTISLDGKILDE